MSEPHHHIFGPDFVLGGVLHDPDLNFQFEVWSRTAPLPDHVVDRVFATWRRASRKNVPKRGQKIQIQWIGDSIR
jgi:hypothetical protein